MAASQSNCAIKASSETQLLHQAMTHVHLLLKKTRATPHADFTVDSQVWEPSGSTHGGDTAGVGCSSRNANRYRAAHFGLAAVEHELQQAPHAI
jgi:hypothetical protein